MSRFDRFRGDTAKLPGASGSSLPSTLKDGRAGTDLIANAQRLASTTAPTCAPIARLSVNFAIALDATGSMSGLLKDAQASVSEIIKRIKDEAERPIRIQIIAYRDYDMGARILEKSPLTDDANLLIAWLADIKPTGGGANSGEAVEAALANIRERGGFSAVIIAGDEPPNSPAFLIEQGLSQTTHADILAEQFGAEKIPIHTFVVGNDLRTISAFESIANLSGGKSGRLDGSDAMIDMAVMSMLAALDGANAVRRYIAQHQLAANAKAFATLLVSGPNGQ
jgi:hypothetical protein